MLFRKRVQIVCKGGLTHQSFRDQCDIGRIMRKYGNSLANVPPPASVEYADFSNVVDYQTAQSCVLAADAAFKALPSAVRNRFYNDPAQFLVFAQDPANRDAMVEMGLLSPSVSDAPIPASVPAEAAAKA